MMDCLLCLVKSIQALRDVWEDEPIVSTELGEFADVFSLDLAERLLFGGLPLSAVRLFEERGQVPSRLVAKSRERGASAANKVVDGAREARRVRGGATLVLEELRTFSPEVARFAAAVTRAPGYDTYCAAFLTPASSRGVAPHYDSGSVFIRQVAGSKGWRISAPPQRWPSREFTSGIRLDTEPVLDVVLHAGDCRYIPRGFVHAGEATREGSAHLTIGPRPVTWKAVRSAYDSQRPFGSLVAAMGGSGGQRSGQ